MVPRDPRSLQGAADRCLRAVAATADRKDPEIRAARARQENRAVTGLPSFDLTGEVALVTGASSGIGRHLAELLAAAGAKVGLAARRVDRLEEVYRDIAAAGGQSLPVACDVTQTDSVA